MTAMNLWKQPDAAYLLTDTAYYDDDGVVQSFGPKIIEMAILPLAIAFTGRDPGSDRIVAFLERLQPRQAEDVVAALPDMLRELKAAADADNPGGRNEMGLGVAMFSYERNRPEAYRCDTFAGWMGDWYEPYTVAPALSAINYRGALGLEGLLGRKAAADDPASFDPERDGLALIEAQRARPFKAYDDGKELFCVGGQAVLTRVDGGQGVRHCILAEWPDRIGERIAA